LRPKLRQCGIGLGGQQLLQTGFSLRRQERLAPAAMSLGVDRATLLELLPHPAYRRQAKTGKLRYLNAAFTLFVELQDAFPHRQRDCFHPHTLASFLQNVNLYHLWKRSRPKILLLGFSGRFLNVSTKS
jgi:hypothetical protein